MNPYYEHAGIVIYHGDCREILPTLPKCDLLLTDPPFSVPVKYHAAEGEYPRSWGDLLVMEPFFKEAFTAMKDATKPTGQLYVCCDANTYPIFYKVGYSLFPRSHLIVWYKPTGRRGGGWKHSHELIIHFSGMEAEYSEAFNQDVIGIMPVRTLDRVHPAEKPGELLTFLAEAAPTRTGETLVVDPFMGGGTLLEIARQMGWNAIGIEIEERYCEIAAKRLSQEVFDFPPALSQTDHTLASD